MVTDSIRDIIDFAIEREQEACDFYTGLAGRVKLEAVASELMKMADMELWHRRKLESVDVGKFISEPADSVPDLKITDYTVNIKPSDDMSWPDIVNLAMHREMASVALYTDLAKMVTDPAVRSLFEHLTAEEEKHKFYLETIWDEEVMKGN